MPHTIQNKKQLLTRIRRVKGQCEAIEKALEQEEECSTVLQQLSATRGALSSLMLEVLNGHIRGHLSKDAKEEEIEVVLSVLRSYLK